MSDMKKTDEALKERGYQRGRLLGRGSFSEVYLVRNVRGEEFACKISGRPELLEREADVLRRLDHPLFPTYVSYWRGEKGYLVMEYVTGCSLEEKIGQRGGFSAESAVQIGMEAASGLRWLHEQEGLLYRDLKPANLILCQNGRVRLVDFGCVCNADEKVTAKAGSPGFAAPEQMRDGERLTAACDVYGLGKTLEAVLGKRKHGQRKLKKVIAACTRENVSSRLPDMRSVLAALGRCTGEKGHGLSGYGWEREILKGDIQIQKNIWKSRYKIP
jgi:serine/threonine-protein kinase